jgi:hypothetical protein
MSAISLGRRPALRMTSPVNISAATSSQRQVSSARAQQDWLRLPHLSITRCLGLLNLATPRRFLPLASSTSISSLRVISTPPRLRDSANQTSSPYIVRIASYRERSVSISPSSKALDNTANRATPLDQWMMRCVSYLLFLAYPVCFSPGCHRSVCTFWSLDLRLIHNSLPDQPSLSPAISCARTRSELKLRLDLLSSFFYGDSSA